MFKNVIAPIQAWLLSQGECVGCGKELPKKTGNGMIRVDCACGRIYMYDATVRIYRRATTHEVRT